MPDIGTGPYQLRRSNSGNLAMFAAIRRASSLVSSLAAKRRPADRVHHINLLFAAAIGLGSF
jgi:hypothetical protein